MNQPTAVHSFVIYLLAFVSYIIVSSLIELQPNSQAIYLCGMSIIHVTIIFLPPLIYSYVKHFSIKETFHLRIPPLPVFFVSFLVIISGIIIIAEVNSLLAPLFKPYEAPIKEMEKQLFSLADYNRTWFLFSATFVPAICEEFLFRGFILSGLMNTAGKTRAVILSAILFGIMHFLLPRIVMVTLIGILFGVLLILTRSIIIPIIAHFINNAIVLLLMLDSQDKDYSQEFSDSSLIIPVLSIIIFIVGVHWLIKHNKKSQ